MKTKIKVKKCVPLAKSISLVILQRTAIFWLKCERCVEWNCSDCAPGAYDFDTDIFCVTCVVDLMAIDS